MVVLERRPRDCKLESFFLKYARNITSQGGEDGILEELFRIIGTNTDPLCVDVGAWDGIHLSNIFHLVNDLGWYGVLFEADEIRSKQSAELYRNNSKVTCVCDLIEIDGPRSLYKHLIRLNIKRNFDFLSIDIDGADYHVWHSLCHPREDSALTFRPRVVCIEFNPTIPNEIVFIQNRDVRIHQGSSLRALTELGASLQYKLVATTTFNAIFVDEAYGAFLPRADYSIDALHTSTMITHLFQTYDGELKLCGPKKLIWHKIPINPQKFQILKPRDRKFPFAPSSSPSLQRLSQLYRQCISLSYTDTQSDVNEHSHREVDLDTNHWTEYYRRLLEYSGKLIFEENNWHLIGFIEEAVTLVFLRLWDLERPQPSVTTPALSTEAITRRELDICVAISEFFESVGEYEVRGYLSSSSSSDSNKNNSKDNKNKNCLDTCNSTKNIDDVYDWLRRAVAVTFPPVQESLHSLGRTEAGSSLAPSRARLLGRRRSVCERLSSLCRLRGDILEAHFWRQLAHSAMQAQTWINFSQSLHNNEVRTIVRQETPTKTSSSSSLPLSLSSPNASSTVETVEHPVSDGKDLRKWLKYVNQRIESSAGLFDLGCDVVGGREDCDSDDCVPMEALSVVSKEIDEGVVRNYNSGESRGREGRVDVGSEDQNNSWQIAVSMALGVIVGIVIGFRLGKPNSWSLVSCDKF